ncbi:MAG: hypothetical protein AN484_24550 [Aphanizomenon flos-aquae WA102]|uniref:DNA pilot protein n=1 Tax=Aphanizomenon flos-aquae WA102 TaxID=1710896 RepID=A0A1B7WLT4_APHFL|nr:MAG: hypothetical protein AN484_24550 [Aphanizomenon flos-aquae WA102]
MPFPIAAALGAASTILPPVMTAITNRQNRKYALEDWNRQNAYNHPKQQMQRLQEAGLNPNLVYGGGATTTAQPVKSPDMQVPNIDLQKVPETLGAYQGYKNQQLEAQKVQKAMQLTDSQIKATDAQTLATLTGIDLKKLDISSKQILNQFLPEVQQANLEKTKVSTGVMVSENQMKQLMFPKQLDKLLAEIGNINARTSKVPFEKAQLQQAVKNMQTNRHYQQLTESQKVQMGNILQESELIKQNLNRGAITKQLVETDLLKIKKQFKELGLSETAVSDIMGDIIKIMVPSTSKTTKVIHSKQ